MRAFRKQQRHMAKKVAKGICAICTRPRVTEWYCQKHRDIHNQAARAYRAEQKCKAAQRATRRQGNEPTV